MSTVKITFRSTPYITPDSDYADPLYRKVHMLVNGTPWMLDMPVSRERVGESALSCANSGIIRASTFPAEIEHDLGVKASDLIRALDFDQYNRPEWVR